MEKYQKVLDLLKAKNGRFDATIDPQTGNVVWEEDLTTLLGDMRYRLPQYISRIRKVANLEIKGIRQGRKVVAYVLTAVAPAEETTATVPTENT